MKRNVGILIFDEAEVLDFAGPFEVFSTAALVLKDEELNVFTIGRTGEPISAVNGLVVTPRYHFGNHPRIDILVMAGGQGTRALLEDSITLDWIKEIHASNEISISICSASRLVGKLGLLEGRPFCTHHEVYEHMEDIAPEAFPQRHRRFIQSSDRLFTSGGISAGIDLSFHVVKILYGIQVARDTAEYMEYDCRYLELEARKAEA